MIFLKESKFVRSTARRCRNLFRFPARVTFRPAHEIRVRFSKEWRMVRGVVTAWEIHAGIIGTPLRAGSLICVAKVKLEREKLTRSG